MNFADPLFRRRPTVSRLALALWLGGVSACGLAVAAAGSPLAGRALADVLRDAQSDGIRIIFTDQSVPPNLRVDEEPRASEPVARLREVLQPHQLELDEVSPGVYVIRRDAALAVARPVLADSSHQETLPAEVEIIASRYTIEAPSSDTSFELGSAAMARQPALFDDATRSLRRFPGTAGQDLSSRLFVRGGAPEDNLVMLDGVPLYDPVHLPGLPLNFSILDPTVIGRVNLYSGVLPLQYGDRMGALVDVHLRDPGESFGGRVAVGTLNSSALLSGPVLDDRGDWLLFSRRGPTGTLRPTDPQIENAGLQDSVGRVRFRVGEHGTLSVGALAALDSARLSNDFRLQLDDESARYYSWVAYDRDGGRMQSRTLLLSYSQAHSSQQGQSRDVFESTGTLDDLRKFYSARLEQNWSVALSGADTLRWGASFRQDRAHVYSARTIQFSQTVAAFFQRPSSVTSYAYVNTTMGEAGAYWALDRALGAGFTLEAGTHAARAHYSTGQTDSALDPRAGLRFDLSPATRARLSVGRMTQIPSVSELPVERDLERFDNSSASDMRVLAIEHDFGARASVRAELFQKQVSHPQPRVENEFFPAAFLPELRPDQIVVAPQSSRMHGLDIYATGAITGHLSAWMSYSLSKAVDLVDGQQIPRSWNQPQSAGLGIAWEHPWWLLSAEAQEHTSWPETPLLTELVKNQAGAPVSFVRSLGARNSQQRGRYISLNLKAEGTLHFAAGSLRLSFEVSNALNRTNVCCNDITFNRFSLGSGEVDESTEQKLEQPRESFATISWEF